MSDWNSLDYMRVAGGFFVIHLAYFFIRFIFNTITVAVEDETVVMVNRFGELQKVIKDAGLHFMPSKIFPWVKTVVVSLQRDFRHYRNVHVNDSRGTTVIVDLWLEFRIVDPAKALFKVEDWEQSLQSLVTHATTSILCTKDFKEILCHRTELSQDLQKDIYEETSRWGIEIEFAFIRKVSLLERDHLEARTNAQVASLIAEAKGQYPAAIGRAFDSLRSTPEVLKAYNELYELSQLRPHRTIYFKNFADGEINAAEAAMIMPSLGDHSTSQALSESESRLNMKQ